MDCICRMDFPPNMDASSKMEVASNMLSNINMTSIDLTSKMDSLLSKMNMSSTRDLPLRIPLQTNIFQPWMLRPALFGFKVIFVISLTYVIFLAYTPKVDSRAPAFTSDTVPLIGSWGFFTRKWTFWKNSVANSKTGNFSFWLGKHHVTGLSGPAGRKLFLDNSDLDFVTGAALIRLGPDFVPPINEIFNPGFHHGRSYFQKRLLEQQKTEPLAKHLPSITRDARNAFSALANNLPGVINPASTCYRLVVQQGTRIVCTDEISDNPKLLESLISTLTLLMSTTSIHTIAVPGLPSWSHMKRKYGRWSLKSLVTPIVEKRMKKNAPRVDDALQTFIDAGDSKKHIVDYFTSVLFIASANAGIISGAILNIVAHHHEWQEKIYNEIKAIAADSNSADKNASLVEQLDSIPLETWETAVPSLELCLKEAIRMWVAFPMIRLNMSKNPIPIPGSNEVIPAGGFTSYNTIDVHYNEEIYPNATTFDPERFQEGREEFKKQTYGFVGWGQGRHPCMGMRWARIQQKIIIGYALAMYKWSGCDAQGQPTHFDRKTDINAHAPSVPQGLYCKYVAREE